MTDRSGEIVFRALWAGDERGMTQALEAAARGERPSEAVSNRRVAPMAKGIGMMREVARRAGPRAEAALWRAAPPVALLAWIADLYRPLPPQWRTAAAVTTLGVAAATKRGNLHDEHIWMGLVAGLVATAVLSALMLMKQAMNLMPQLGMRWLGLAKAGLQVRLTAMACNLRRMITLLRGAAA
jgi:hypothetical protein